MQPSNFNLRKITPEVMLLLKKEAARQNLSVNSLLLKLIERGIGMTHPVTKMVYHDLDYLAGTWSNKDQKEFNKKTKSFENIV